MIAAGSYEFGPSNGRLHLKVFREGLAKKVGHDLVIEVGSWSATVNVGDDPSNSSLTATADVGSFRVLEGVGGVKALSEDDKADIKKNITKKILTMPGISFRSNSVRVSGNQATVSGDLTIMGRSQPIDLQLTDMDGRVKGTATVVQTRWGIKPFSAMLGTLKVRDAVEVELEASVPQG
ncbi:MAG: YceI family protein [Actinomycetota bacterium]